MAVCVQAENYTEFPSALDNYGASATCPEPHASEGGPEVQVVKIPSSQQSPWIHLQAEGLQFWQGEHGADQSTDTCCDWQGGLPPMSYAGGWVDDGSAQPLFQPMSGHGSSRQHPHREKRRFCTSYPEVQHCRRGSGCSFAHSREEIRAPLLSIEEEQQDPAAMTDDFFMYKYKTLWCPIGVQHEWHTCVYAHNYQDARRPLTIGYGARLCPYWSKKDTGSEYSQRCPLGVRCPYAHGAKEQLYHPHYFKTVVCRDLKGKACPRQGLCAFFHHRAERRCISSNPSDDMDYGQPLLEEVIDDEWMAEFLAPPFLSDISRGEDGGCNLSSITAGSCNLSSSGNGDWTKYGGPQAPHAPYGMGMQRPMVFLLAYAPMSHPQAPQMGPMGNQMDNQTGNKMSDEMSTMRNQMCGPTGMPDEHRMANWSLVNQMNEVGNQLDGQMVPVPLQTPQHADV